MRYKLAARGFVLRDDGTFIPASIDNKDYQDYQAWLAAGNTPDPASVIAQSDPADIDLLQKQMKALAMLMRQYINQTRAGNTTAVTVAQLKADFKTAFDALP